MIFKGRDSWSPIVNMTITLGEEKLACHALFCFTSYFWQDTSGTISLSRLSAPFPAPTWKLLLDFSLECSWLQYYIHPLCLLFFSQLSSPSFNGAVSKMAPNDPYLLVFMPLCSLCSHWKGPMSVTNRILQKWQMMTSEASHKKQYVLHFAISWTAYSGKRQPPCQKNSKAIHWNVLVERKWRFFLSITRTMWACHLGNGFSSPSQAFRGRQPQPTSCYNFPQNLEPEALS